MKLASRRIDVPNLKRSDLDEMYALFAKHFAGTDRDRFEADLVKKDWVVQLLDQSTGKVGGFSTQMLLKLRSGNAKVNAIYSGDTIVDPAFWNEKTLLNECGHLFFELVEQVHPEPLYWFLITKGYKTYRFLPVFFHEFFPCHDRPFPAPIKQTVDLLGNSLFGDNYDEKRGLVVPTSNKERLRSGIAEITDGRLEDPHVRFFLERNPNYAEGCELCCLALLDKANLTRAGIRLLASGVSTPNDSTDQGVSVGP